jgi:site-specific DNA-cytosine methylase
MDYIAHVPLAGGFALGNMNITGKPPVAITSFSNFEANDALLRRYLAQRGHNVSYHQLDKLDINHFTFLTQKHMHLDFVTAVPPCSGLSQAAQRKAGSRGECEVNDWMYRSAEFILGGLQPIIYAFENAPNLFTGSGDLVRQKLIEIGKKYEYAITFYKTNTLLHGIPQYRPRTFGIFYQGDRAPILNSYNKKAPHISEYLKQIPKEAKHQQEYMVPEWDITQYEIYKYLKHLYGDNWRKVMTDYKFHLTTYDYLQRVNLMEDFKEFQKTLPDASPIVTKNIEHIMKNKAEGRGARINYRVLEVDRDYTYAVIGEMMGKQVHPTEDRLLNIREHMHLMGLPHDYNLEGQKEYAKITQNVPVKTCEDITTEIVEIIKGNRRISSKPVLMQDNTKETIIKQSKILF